MLPDAVLRSVLLQPADPPEILDANYLIVQPMVADLPEGDIDRQLLTFVEGLFQSSKHLPGYALVYQHFRDRGDTGDGVAMAVVTRLELVQAAKYPLLSGADLHYALSQYRDKVFGDGLSQALFQASTIYASGLDQPVIHNGQRVMQHLQGPHDAFAYLSNEMAKIGRLAAGAPAEGALHTDADAMWKLYETRRDNPLAIGVKSGIAIIDDVHHGLRRGELALVIGFTGHLKSTFVYSWAYKAAVYQGKNVALVSCETPLDDLRVIFYVMHASHPKFQGDPCYLTLKVDEVVRGQLTRAQEAFFREVVTDFSTCQTYGRVIYREPSADMTMADIQRWAEAQHRRAPIDLLVIDYLGLVRPGKDVRASDTGSRMNDVIRTAKLLAMGFAAGRGVSLLSPFQTNREGWKNAEKNGGRYRLVDISWANEAEKSSDFIYYTWLDDMLRSTKELAMGNLKTRLVAMIPAQFRVFADPVTRLVDNLDLTSPAQAPVDLS